MFTLGHVISLVLICSQVSYLTGSGNLFVGLIGYSNPELYECCQNEALCDMEPYYCSLVFEVGILGLNSSHDRRTLRPSDHPIGLEEAQNFPTDGVENSMSFAFNKWPGAVNVTVSVYNDTGDDAILVDQFQTVYVNHTSRDYFGPKFMYSTIFENSSMNIALRYQCSRNNAPSCFTDCVDHGVDEPCPVYGVTPTVYTHTDVTPTELTSTDVASTELTSTDVTSTELTYTDVTPTASPGSNCSYNDTMGNVSQRPCDEMKTPTTPPHKPTPTPYADPEETKSMKQSTEQTTTTTWTSTASITKTSTLSTSTTSKTHRTPPSTSTSTIFPVTTPIVIYQDKILENWPAIVGGVLGSLIVLSLVGYFLYRKRQKKMRKRQEIYNVNPKILRNFEEYEENGTSGRADVPLETEQY